MSKVHHHDREFYFRMGSTNLFACLDVRFAQITIKVPANKCGKSLSLYYVGCKEQGDSNEKLECHLLTSEPVTTTAQAQEIISYYEQRWLVEEFHKAWKSDGIDVEALQLQSKDNLERVAVIQAFIAIRLLQLRANSRKQENSSCESVLPGICWKLLWVKQENKPLPSTALQSTQNKNKTRAVGLSL